MELQQVIRMIQSITGDFHETRVSNNSVKINCPCHRDKTPSLQITQDDGRILMHCHGGCRTDDILQAVGLTYKDLQPPEQSSVTKSPSMWDRMLYPYKQKYGDGVRLTAVYDYQDADGKYLYSKIRVEGGSIKGKQIAYRTIDRNAGTYTTGKPKGQATLYRLPELIKAVQEKKRIFITEGEKDVEHLRNRGLIATTAGGTQDWKSDFAKYFIGAETIILPDNDQAGYALADRIKNDLTDKASSVRIVRTSEAPKGDVSDFFEEGHTLADLEALIENNADAVQTMLSYKTSRTGETKVAQCVRNHEIVLENDLRFKGKIRFDEFSRQVFLQGTVSWEDGYQARPWSVTDDSHTFAILQSEYGLTSRNDFADAVRNVAYRKRFHPVRDVLEALPYKGDGYIRKLLPSYLGASDSEYNYAVMRLFMLGAVSRVYEAGCKFDFAPILHGGQGIGKSTLLRKLALSDAWFSDSLDSLDSDKAAQSLAGTWINELGELKSFSRTSGTGAVKRFISATQDRYRIPYERRAETFPRQCVFAGTVNQTNFLQDETGNRRFLIVHCGVQPKTKDIFSDDAMEDIKSAWAEALHIYKTEHPQLILPREFEEQASELQSDAMEDDGTEGMIRDWIDRYQGDKVCAIQVWQEALNEEKRPPKWQATVINNILSSLPDWERVTTSMRFEHYGTQRGFRRRTQSPDFVDYSPNEEIEGMVFN